MSKYLLPDNVEHRVLPPTNEQRASSKALKYSSLIVYLVIANLFGSGGWLILLEIVPLAIIVRDVWNVSKELAHPIKHAWVKMGFLCVFLPIIMVIIVKLVIMHLVVFGIVALDIVHGSAVAIKRKSVRVGLLCIYMPAITSVIALADPICSEYIQFRIRESDLKNDVLSNRATQWPLWSGVDIYGNGARFVYSKTWPNTTAAENEFEKCTESVMRLATDFFIVDSRCVFRQGYSPF